MSDSPSFLLVGNSLPLLGVDLNVLQQLVPAGIRPHRFVVESTDLFDWKYALRRLFEDGARPDFVVVSVGVSDVLPTTIRGEYSAYYLFRTQDLSEIADSLRYDNTRRSSLYFARYSQFFAGRSPLRNFVLNRVDRPYGDLMKSLGVRAGHAPSHTSIVAAAHERLGDMRRFVESRGAKLVLLIPPGFDTVSECGVIEGAAQAGVSVVAPVRQGDWGQDMFSDGFHLNEKGAAEFTRRLVPQLVQIVSESHNGHTVCSACSTMNTSVATVR